MAIGGGLGCYLLMRPKLKITSEYNLSIDKYNNELEEKNKKLTQDHANLSNSCDYAKQKYDNLIEENKQLERQIKATQDTVNTIYETSLSNMQDKLELDAIKSRDYYQNKKEQYQTEYFNTMAELAKDLEMNLAKKGEEIAAADKTLGELRSKIDAAIAANLREEEKKNNLQFYTLDLANMDVQEVEKIKSITPYLRNSRPLNKAIWEAYYRNPTSDLVNRIVKGKSGIYKITCLLDEKVYVGQAVDLAERFKQHVKCGIGIDAPRNKLYLAMEQFGVENFTFEVIEYCPATQLNEREKYWIDFYKSNAYGFNMTAGNSTEKKEKK